jgi:hypothetical protein
MSVDSEMVTERHFSVRQGMGGAATGYRPVRWHVAQLKGGRRRWEDPHTQISRSDSGHDSWATNLYTESIIAEVEEGFGKDFWGFWMLGGMSGGGMGFLFHPSRKREAQTRLLEIMRSKKQRYECGIPFAMDPVVYEFSVNEHGSLAELLAGERALHPSTYYSLTVPPLLRKEPRTLSSYDRTELEHFSSAARTDPALSGVLQNIIDRILPEGEVRTTQSGSLEGLLDRHGFDRVHHERIKADLRGGRIGLAQNRLPINDHPRCEQGMG